MSGQQSGQNVRSKNSLVMLSNSEWHARFKQQVLWTADLRRYIFDKVRMGSVASILDVGCGTGALEPEIMAYTRAYVTAIDIDHSRVQYAKKQFQSKLDKRRWIEPSTYREYV